MQKSLMVGLTEKDMDAMIHTFDLKPYYHNTLFPVKQNGTLEWKALEMQTGMRVAADVVARGASARRRTREPLQRVSGDIPKLLIARSWDEEEYEAYDIALYLAKGNPDQTALVEAWAEDMRFCWNGVANRVEWIALKQISLGKVSFTAQNNVGIVTEYDVDYQLGTLPTNNLQGYQTGSASWSNTTSAKPISVDFKAIVKGARAHGIYLKYAYMNLDTFNKFAETKEVKDLCANYLSVALDITTSPSVEQVNATLKKLPYLYGLQIGIIDQDIAIESEDGQFTNGNPFEDNVVMFSETMVLGHSFYKTPAEMRSKNAAVMKVQNGYTCIKKFSTEDPFGEHTIGFANVFPGWENSARCFLMDTANNTWNK